MSELTPRTAKATIPANEQYNTAATVCYASAMEELERELNALKASMAKPESTDSLPEDFRRIALLFTSRCTRTKMTAGEKTAWSKTKSFISNADIQLLEWFYSLDKSAEYDQTWHRKGKPAALLNNLNAQLDLAYALRSSLRKSQPKLGTAPQW